MTNLRDSEQCVQYVKMSDAIAEVRPAAGVAGMLCRDIDATYFFRVTHADGSFTDYTLRHDDLAMTIEVGELASFYRIGEDHFLDHEPAVLGLTSYATRPEAGGA